MLGLAIKWYYKNEEDEPLIAIIGQSATLLVLIFEKSISNIKTKNVYDSEIEIDFFKGDNVKTKKIKNSKINIKGK